MQRRSAAYEAGLRPGDIIVQFNTQPVTTPADLYRYIADAKIGTTGTLRVLREGRAIDLRVPITAEVRTRR
jgi:serine protease Do